MKDPQTLIDEGADLAESGKLDEAIKFYDTALEIDPNNAMGWYNKGVALCRKGSYSEAIKCYDRALEINPDDAEAMMNKGGILFNKEEYDKAIECFCKAYQLRNNMRDKGTILDVMIRRIASRIYKMDCSTIDTDILMDMLCRQSGERLKKLLSR